MNSLISIVVPVYNVQNYLDCCVKSLISQSYSNIEIILVDDGSTDNCANICDEWKKKDPRIRVIHKQNGGLSDARNAGMAMATGAYIGFVDSDDYIHKDMYRLLYENLLENNSDISACGIELFWDNDSKTKMLTNGFNGTLTAEEAMLAIINEDNLKQPVVNRLYKTDQIRNIVFPINKQHEDVFWSYQALGVVKKISVFDTPLYFYRQRQNSIMGSGFSLKSLDSLEAKQQRCKYIDIHFPSVSQAARINLWFSCIYAMQMSLRHLSKHDYAISENHILRIKLNCPKFCIFSIKGIKPKMWCLFSKISFILTCKLRNRFGIGL